MRTDELINTLVADHAVQPRPKPVGHGLVMAIIGGLAISGALFALTLGVRPDIVSALGTWRFDLKLSANLVLVIAATWVSLRLSSPTTKPLSGMRALLVPALLLLAAVIYELVTVPASAWPSRALGATVFAIHCTNDSPLFVAIWYALAIGLMSMFGLVVGRHALRW